jgi:transposase
MSQNNSTILYAGLDVAKSSLQLHLDGRSHLLANDPEGHAQLLKLLRPYPQAQLVCEATGGYEQPVARVRHAAAVAVSIVEAGRVRHFARAQGQRAKTDPIDAAVLTAFAVALRPTPTAPPTAQQERLAELSTRRRQLIQTRVAEGNRAEHYTDALCRRQARQLLRLLNQQIEACDQAILELIAADAGLAHKAKRLDAIPGVGPVVASTVLAEMPELGQLSHAAAAALAGLAPYNRDSGDHSGARHISGGRMAVRGALYMATMCAVKHDRILKAFYQRLRDAGKKPLVALTACMRKLIVLMNRLLKNENFQLAS